MNIEKIKALASVKDTESNNDENCVCWLVIEILRKTVFSQSKDS